MSLYLSLGSEHTALTSQELQSALCNASTLSQPLPHWSDEPALSTGELIA